ncbi:MAG: molybdopterin molybdotransferase MoeA [Thermoplasmata archaeon]|nr:molybdopterin molybdotransferase MoeA [Thermoplasmata archaeon]
MRMRPFGELMEYSRARQLLLDRVEPVRRIEPVPLVRALGRVISRELRAPHNVPAFARATWDGYALRSVSTRGARPGRPVSLELAGEVFAEGALHRRLSEGEAVAIATGGAMPRGADTVIIFEETRVVGSTLWVPRYVRPGERVANPGEDFRRGSRLARANEVLTPAALGALASTGASRVAVFAQPVVSILPNGNELRAPGGRLGPGQIHESNNATLGAVVTACGGIPRPLPPLPDVETRIERAIRNALDASDLVLVTGGSSVGEHDYLPAIFPRLGRLLFHGIAVRPGKPTLAALSRRRLVIGMPGHPTSCLSNALWLLQPVLRRLGRLPGPGWVEGSARLAGTAMVPSPGLATVVPLAVRHGWARPTFRDSSAITSLSGANAYTLLEPNARPLRKGARIPVNFLLPPLAADPFGGPPAARIGREG